METQETAIFWLGICFGMIVAIFIQLINSGFKRRLSPLTSGDFFPLCTEGVKPISEFPKESNMYDACIFTEPGKPFFTFDRVDSMQYNAVQRNTRIFRIDPHTKKKVCISVVPEGYIVQMKPK